MIADIIILLVISCIPLFWLSGGAVIAGYDSGFRFTGFNHIVNLLQSWNFIQNYGTNWSIYRAFAVLQFPEAALTTLTGSLHTAQVVIFSGWFLAISGSMYCLVRRVFPENKFRFFRLYGAIFYTINFFILNGWMNAERAKFSLYTALPLAVLLLFEEAFGKRKVIVHAILFGLLYAVWNGGGSPPLFGATLIILGVTGLSFIITRWIQHGIKEAFRLSGTYFLFVVSFFIWNVYWIIPLVHLTNSSYGNAVASQGGIGGLIEWEKVFSRYASFTNLFRLQGFPDWYDNVSHTYANTFLQNPILMVLSFFPSIAVLLGTLRFGIRDGKKTQFLSSLFLLLVVGLVFTAGSHPPTGYIYILLMKYIPGFAVFRSSFYKFAPAVWLPIILLSGYYLSLFIDTFCKRNTWKIGIWCLILIGIFAYHFPFYQHTSFTIPNGFSTRLNIPDYVYTMKREIEQQTTINDRILLLPDLDPGFITLPMDAYTWGFYSADILPRMLVNRSIVAGDANDDGITRRMYQDIYAGNSEEFYQLASIVGITHILWRGDVRQSQTLVSIHPLDTQQKTLETMSGIHVIAQSGPWKLYRLDIASRPMIYQTDYPIVVTGAVTGDVLVTGDTTVVRINTQILETGNKMIGLECIMCDKDEFTKFEQGIYLPLPKHTLLAKIKSFISPKPDTSKKPPQEQVDTILSELLQTISHVVYESDQAKKDHISPLINKLSLLFDQLSDRDRIIYANRLYAYMLAIRRLTVDSGIEKEVTMLTKPFIDQLVKSVFVSDSTTLRYLVTISSTDSYQLVSSDPLTNIVLDHQTILYPQQSVILNEGTHFVELQRKNKDAPYLFFSTGKLNKTTMQPIVYERSSSGQYYGNIKTGQSTFLVFNQRYDSRWSLMVTLAGKKVMITDHMEANGFANAWKLPDQYVGPFEIHYR